MNPGSAASGHRMSLASCCRESLVGDLVENHADARLVLGLPLLFLRNVGLHDRDGRERKELRRSHAPNTIARHRGHDGDRGHQALRDRGTLAAQQPRIRDQPVHRRDEKAQPAHTGEIGRLREHGRAREREPERQPREREVRHVVQHHLGRHPHHRHEQRQRKPRDAAQHEERHRRHRDDGREHEQRRDVADDRELREDRERDRDPVQVGGVAEHAEPEAEACGFAHRPRAIGARRHRNRERDEAEERRNEQGERRKCDREEERRAGKRRVLSPLRKQPSANDHSRISFSSSADL